ncbi:MAG: hypothetical protein ACI9LM_000006 [Alteromonadaceae bacterium]|jgi:hypothetical protein
MDSIKKHYPALFVIALLICVKFVIVPLFDWQNEMITTNALLTKRLVKSSAVIDNQALFQSQLSKMDKQLEKGEQLFFANSPQSLFQLAQQKKLEQLFTQHNMTINGLRWKVPITKKNWRLILNEVRFTFKGSVADLQQLQMTLESQVQWYDNYNFNYTLDERHEKKLGQVSGRMSLKLYMRELV